MILSADYGGFVRVWSLAKTMSAVSDHVARSMKQKARREARHAEMRAAARLLGRWEGARAGTTMAAGRRASDG